MAGNCMGRMKTLISSIEKAVFGEWWGYLEPVCLQKVPVGGGSNTDKINVLLGIGPSQLGA